MGGILLFLALLIWGVICTFSPQTAWEMTDGWKYKNAEPSEGVLKYLRVVGVVQIVAAFYILFTM